MKSAGRLPSKPGEETTSRLMAPQCKSPGAGASGSSRKSREVGGAGRKRCERRGNACHLLPGLPVLDVPLGQGQIRTEPDTRPHSQANLNQRGWERHIKALVSASNHVPLVSPAELGGPWGTQDSRWAAGLDGLTPRSLPVLGSLVVERGPWKWDPSHSPTHRCSLWVHTHLEPMCSHVPTALTGRQTAPAHAPLLSKLPSASGGLRSSAVRAA